jgi:hypothetical protein
MGAPNIESALKDNSDAIAAVKKACDQAWASLQNDETKGVAYINQHTKGIISTLSSNSVWYSKFSEDFSLEALDTIIDSTVKVAVDAIKLEAGDDNPDLAAQSAEDVGSLVKGVLALAASSSSTEENLQVTFSYLIAGDNNFAVYYAYNSTTVDAQNAWGHKDITVVANTYIVAQVEPNPDITRGQMLQKDLTTLKRLNDKYDDALVAAENQAQVDQLNFRQKEIKKLLKKIEKETNAELQKDAEKQKVAEKQKDLDAQGA